MVLATAVFAVVWIVFINVFFYLLNEHGLVRLCLRGSNCTTNFSTNRAAGLLQRDRPSTYWAWDQHDATHLVTSYVGSASGGAALLLVYRVLAFVYFAAALLLIEFAGKGLDGDFLPYFTNWTHIALGVYAVLGVVLSLRHRRTERRDALGDFSVTRPYGLLEKLFVITLTLASACGAFLTLFYWGVIYTRGSSVRVDNAMRHGGNVVVFVGEYLLSRTPVVGRWFHFALIYASMYAVFLWVYSGQDGEEEWIYTALDWNNSDNASYYVILPVLVYLGFLLMYLVAGLREFMGRGQCCCMCCPCFRACGPACTEDDTGQRQYVDRSTVRPAAVTIPSRV